MNKFLSLSLFIFFVYSSGFAQKTWKHFDTHNGLLNNEVSDILIENNQRAWLASDSGLCEFDVNSGSVISTITTGNSALNSEKISMIERANNRIWMVTDSGLSSLSNGMVSNYTPFNGLLSTDIRGLAIDTNNQLWVATPQGVSYFDGTSFIHDTTVAAYQIVIDDSNRVFIISFSLSYIFNRSASRVFVLDNGAWTQLSGSGLGISAPFIRSVRFKKVNGRILVLTPDFSTGFYELNYPLQLDSIVAKWNNFAPIGLINNFEIIDASITKGGEKWIIGNAFPNIFSGKTDSITPHFLSPAYSSNGSVSWEGNVATSDSIVIVSSANGIYISEINHSISTVEYQLETNSIRANVNSYGALFNNFFSSNPGFEMPKDSNLFGIYAANIFVTSKRNGDTTFKANMIDPFTPAHAPGPVVNNGTIQGDWIIKLKKSDIDQHKNSYNQTGYSPQSNITNWFAFGDSSLSIPKDQAPFIDVDNDGCYNPINGDYPAIKGDEAIYWINHIDKLEYHGLLYAHDDSTNAALDQSIFLEYTIINRDTVQYDSIKMGMFVDFDLGNPINDFVGCDSLNNIFYAYNATPIDFHYNNVKGYLDKTPAVGVKFLSDSMDGFIYNFTGPGSLGVPSSKNHIHNYLNSKLQNGRSLTYGDGGLSFNNPPTKYMFTGDPVSGAGWTEFDNNSGPGDRRGIGHIPYFSLNSNERKTISMVIGYGQTNSTNHVIGKNVSEMIQILNQAKLVWDTTSYPTGVLAATDSCISTTSVVETKLPVDQSDFQMYPNPATESVIMEFNKFRKNELLQVISINGKVVKEIEAKKAKISLDISTLSKGLYFIKTEKSVKKLVIH